MLNDVFGQRGAWSIDKYHLEAGKIVCDFSGKLKHYNPLDYVENPVPLNSGPAMTILESMLSIDRNNPDKMLKWCNAFGLPFLSVKGKPNFAGSWLGHLFNIDINDLDKSIEVSHFCLLLDFLHKTVALRNAFRKSSIDLQEILDRFSCETFMPALGLFFEGDPDYNANFYLQNYFCDLTTPHQKATELLERVIGIALDGLNVSISLAGEPKLIYAYASPMQAAFFELALSMVKSTYIRKCENPRCNNFFTTNREDKLHCSPNCQRHKNSNVRNENCRNDRVKQKLVRSLWVQQTQHLSDNDLSHDLSCEIIKRISQQTELRSSSIIRYLKDLKRHPLAISIIKKGEF